MRLRKTTEDPSEIFKKREKSLVRKKIIGLLARIILPSVILAGMVGNITANWLDGRWAINNYGNIQYSELSEYREEVISRGSSAEMYVPGWYLLTRPGRPDSNNQ